MAASTGDRTGAIDAKVLGRVRGLLAKAESTTFPEEAEALMAKAQALMARHAIDVALVDRATAEQTAPDHRRLAIDPPYVSAKQSVLGAVAGANRCQVVFVRGDDRAHLFGYAADLDAVEVLFTSLLLQATTALSAAGSRRDVWGRSRTRSFRHAFLLAYAQRIGERLAAATEETVAEVDADRGGGLVPVLADRQQAVDRLVASAFPRLTTRRVSISSPEGVDAGFAAADRADIGQARIGGHRTELEG